MKELVKIFLSLIVALSAIYPYLYPSDKSGSIETVAEFGIAGSLAIVVVFFAAVAFYCKDLEKCLRLIQPENRSAQPKSVWFMFLLPYNFIEDFFIIINISESLQNELKSNPRLKQVKDNGLVTGMGWCIAQILSLIPNLGGQIAGAIALVLWIWHWSFIKKVNKLLGQ
jgi:hypothetical protein